jgi:Ulp1 family protease
MTQFAVLTEVSVQSLPVQTNGHDCGVWVLATVAAVIHGFDSTGLKEVEIADFRRYLYHLVLALPTSTL